MKKLLNQKEICVEILKFIQTVGKISVPDVLVNQKIFASIKFPLYNKKELQSISSDLEKGLDIKTTLLNHSFAFPFFPNFLDDLIRKMNKNTYIYASSFTFLTYLAWNIAYGDSISVDTTIIDLLSALVTIWNYGNSEQIKLISVSAYTQIYSTFFSNENFKAFDGFLSAIYLFFERGRVIPEQCYEILPNAAKWVYNNYLSNPKITDNFFRYLSQLDLPETVAQKLVTITFQSLLQSNYTIFPYIPDFLKLVSINFTSAFLSRVPIELLDCISLQPVINDIPFDSTDPNFIELPKEKNNEFNFKIQKNTFPNGLEISQNIEIPKTNTFNELMHDSIISKFTIIAQCSKNKEHMKMIIANFIELLKIKTSERPIHIFDFYASFFYLCKLFPPDSIGEVNFDLLMNPILFNPEITVFYPCKNFDHLNSIRYYSLELILNISQNYIEEILHRLMPYPLLFTETLHRIIANHQILPDLNDARISLAHGLVSSALYYQSFSNETNNKSIEIARTGILNFISHIFLEKSMLICFFNDYFFSCSFLSLVFEVPLRSFVLDQTLTYLTNSEQVEFDHNLLKIIIRLVENACNYFPDIDYIDLVSDVLNKINESITHRRNLALQYESLTPIIFKAFLTLDTTKNSKTFLYNSLSFLVLISNIHLLNDEEQLCIENAIKNVYENSPSDNIFETIVQLLAANGLIYKNPCFYIRQPKILTTFLTIFENTPKLIDVLQFINDLCSFSPHNCISCHLDHIDLWLLNFIYKNINNDKVNEYIIICLKIIVKISSLISSIEVIKKFNTLLKPINNSNELSYYYIDIFNSLNSIVNNSKIQPSVTIPLSPEYIISISGLNSTHLESFHSVFWVHHDTTIPLYKPKILHLIESTKSIEVSLFSNQVNIYQNNGEYETYGNLKVEIPNKEWILIHFSYEPSNKIGESLFKVSINLSHFEEIIIPTMKWKQKTLINCFIGGITNDSITPEFPSLITCFGMFSSLDDVTLQSLFDNGPCFNKLISLNSCLFFYQPKVNDNNYYFKPFTNGDFKLTNYCSHETFHNSFVDVLIHSFKLKNLIPLFDLIPLKTTKNELVPHFAETILSLFSTLFNESDEAQIFFIEYKGFDLILNSLLKLPSNYRNYNLYLNLFNLLESLNYIELQNKLINDILINYNLWIDIEAENHLRILRHWSRYLFPTYLPKITTNIIELIIALRIFYFYDNKFNVKNVKRNSKLNISECRSIILSICRTMPFYNDSFKYLIGELLNLSEIHQIKDLLSFLLVQISTDLTFINDLKDFIESINLLVSLLNLLDDEINCLIFKIFHQLNQSNLIDNNKMYEHIYLIFYILQKDFIQEKFFKSLTQLMLNEKFYELLPICFWIASYITNDDLINDFIDRLEPNIKYSTNPIWSIWVIILISKIKNERIKEKLILFLILSENEYYKVTFTMFDIILDNYLNINPTEIKESYLHLFYCSLFSGSIESNEKNLDLFFSLSKEFIFFQKNNKQNKAFHEQFKTKTNKINNTKNIKFITLPMIINYLFDEISKPKKRYFGLRIISYNNWIDFPNAIECMNAFLQYNVSIEKYLIFDLIICYFANKIDKKEVENHLKQLKEKNCELIEYQSFIKCMKNEVGASIDLLNNFAEQKIDDQVLPQQVNKYIVSLMEKKDDFLISEKNDILRSYVIKTVDEFIDIYC